MSVHERFIQYLNEQVLCQPTERILLAVSGGRDSVLMAHLFAATGYNIGIAHCNFGLRGMESDADEALVYSLAETLGVPFYVTHFDTEAYAAEHRVSIQMAARELRYGWFETIRASQGYHHIAVAQHQNDHVETLLLNLVRGTGLAGLRGIHAKRGHIIRPILFLKAEEVNAAVQQLQLAYRDDASNFSTKYARNKIRLEVVPKLKELNPRFEASAAANISRFADAYMIVEAHVDQLRNRLFVQRNEGEWCIPIDELVALHPRQFLLHELFKPFDFSETVVSDLAKALTGMPGKHFLSRSHELYVDRAELFLRTLGEVEAATVFIERIGADLQWGGYRFRSDSSVETTVRHVAYNAQFDLDRIVFPLQIRCWRHGDSFHPLGMKGKKLLSDFFVSLKIPVYRKKSIPVVVNGNGDIIWVVPYRIDDRYKISGKTKKVFTLARS